MAIVDHEWAGFDVGVSDPGILTVTFNQPESLNASTTPMKRDLIELLTQAQMDDSIRVLVFTGEGKAFWAGDNLKGYNEWAKPEFARQPIIRDSFFRSTGVLRGP